MARLYSVLYIVWLVSMTGTKLQPTDFTREDISTVERLAAFLKSRDIKNEVL